MRLSTVLLVVAVVGLLVQPAPASHTLDLGDVEVRVGDLVLGLPLCPFGPSCYDPSAGEIVIEPRGVVEVVLPAGGAGNLQFKCLRPGVAIIRLKYRSSGEIHTAVRKVTCLSVKQDD